MQIVYDVLIAVGLLVAIILTVIIMLTGKGDAMSGGGGVRTTFKGKASFDDIMSRWTLILGVSFMAIMLIVDIIGTHIAKVTTH